MRSTRALAITCGVVLTIGLAGCQDEGQTTPEATGTTPTGDVPSGDAPTHEGVTTPSPEWTDNVDKTTLESGHTNDQGEWVAPTHDVAQLAYGHAEANLRDYIKNYPQRIPGNVSVPEEVQDYTSATFERDAEMQLASANGGLIPSDDGSYAEAKVKIISVTPYDWKYKDDRGGVETVILDVCSKTTTRLFDAEGKEQKLFDADGNPRKNTTQKVRRYYFDHQSGWLIDNVHDTGEKC